MPLDALIVIAAVGSFVVVFTGWDAAFRSACDVLDSYYRDMHEAQCAGDMDRFEALERSMRLFRQSRRA